jgi:hypothetical protein
MVLKTPKLKNPDFAPWMQFRNGWTAQAQQFGIKFQSGCSSQDPDSGYSGHPPYLLKSSSGIKTGAGL